MSPDAHSRSDDTWSEASGEDAADLHDGDQDLEGIDDDEREARAREVMDELAETRRRIAEVPAGQVIANHAMGLFELAAIHLSAGPEHLAEAALAIDAMGAVVEGLQGRLGVQEAVLTDALSQIRLAFVQVKATVAGA
jgi:hypothetical protein